MHADGLMEIESLPIANELTDDDIVRRHIVKGRREGIDGRSIGTGTHDGACFIVGGVVFNSSGSKKWESQEISFQASVKSSVHEKIQSDHTCA